MSNHSYALLWDRLSAGRRGGVSRSRVHGGRKGLGPRLEESRLEFHRHAFVFHRLLHRSDQDAHVAPL